MVCPNNFRNKTPEIIEIGMVKITINAARLSPKKSKTINPVKTAPIIPSVIKLLTELIT
ncbi:hypothetical protein D3C86_806380 [compost metagenome]